MKEKRDVELLHHQHSVISWMFKVFAETGEPKLVPTVTKEVADLIEKKLYFQGYLNSKDGDWEEILSDGYYDEFQERCEMNGELAILMFRLSMWFVSRGKCARLGGPELVQLMLETHNSLSAEMRCRHKAGGIHVSLTKKAIRRYGVEFSMTIRPEMEW